MSDVLDQSEVDRLLAAVDTEPEQAEKTATQVFTRQGISSGLVDVSGYDFKRPERVSKDQMRALQTLHEGFARNFGASLSGFLRTIVEVKVASCEQMTYSEFISGLPNPTSFNLIEPDSLSGQMCMEISPLIIYPIIDRLLGGTSQDLFIPQRPVTLIESRLISNVTKRGLSALSEAWASVRELSFKIGSTESNPQLVQIVAPNEVVVVIGFEIKLTNRAGTMNLCIPYNVIEPVMGELSEQSWFGSGKAHDSDDSSEQVGRQLRGAGLELAGVLGQTTITLRELSELAPGDTILLEKRASEPAIVAVEGEEKYHARMGKHRGRRALEILGRIGQNEG